MLIYFRTRDENPIICNILRGKRWTEMDLSEKLTKIFGFVRDILDFFGGFLKRLQEIIRK